MASVVELPNAGAELPLARDPRTPSDGERADAARNRRRVVEAATRLFAQRGVGCVSMDDIAREAGVGKGTLFRRFGDRASLVRSILEDRERSFQDAFLSGPPPLGPGAPAVERLVAFGRGLLDIHAEHGELLVAAEAGAPGARLRGGPYPAYRLHLSVLLAQADPRLDADYLADVLLGALAAELIQHQRTERTMSPQRIADGFESLVRALVR